MRKPNRVVSVVRSFNASPEALYRAFTDVTVMRQWMAAEVEAQPEPGGAFRIHSPAGPDGSPLGPFVGEYLVLEAPTRLLQTFRHVETPPGTTEDETLEVRTRGLWPGLTELTLEHAWIGPPVPRDELAAMKDAFSLWLDGLAALFKRSG